MARTLVAFTLAVTGLLQPTVVAHPRGRERFDGTWPEAKREYDATIQEYRDIRKPWYDTYPARDSLDADKREQVKVDIGVDGWLPTRVYGIPVAFDPARGRKNPILVSILAQELYDEDADFDANWDANVIPDEMEFVLRYRDHWDVVESDDAFVKASFTGKAKRGWGLQAFATDIMPAYIATMEFEYVAPSGSQEPVAESVVEVGVKFPSGKVVWPSRRTEIRIEWLHGSAD